MNTIGATPITPQVANVSLPAAPKAAPVPAGNPRPAAVAQPAPVKVEETFDTGSAERQRYEAVARAAQDIANVFVVSDKRFTIFKDINGQFITRFTSLRDGKVTYEPEPDVLKRNRDNGPRISIKA